MIKKILRNKIVIFVTGDRKREAVYFINFILKDDCSIFLKKGVVNLWDIFKIINSDVVIIEDDSLEDPDKVKSFFYSLEKCVFVFTEVEKKIRTRSLFRGFSEKWALVMDFSLARKVKRKKVKSFLTFGINRKGADFYISNTSLKEKEANFKVNYNANIIPFWIKGNLNTKDIYGILPSLCLAKIFNLNLAKVSFKIKEELVTTKKEDAN